MRYCTLVFFCLLIYGVYSQAPLDEMESARKKKKHGKYTMPVLLGALMIKAIIFPLAFKALAIMSSIAVVLSTMSLIITSIMGYAKLGSSSAQHPHDWAKDDDASKTYHALNAHNTNNH